MQRRKGKQVEEGARKGKIIKGNRIDRDGEREKTLRSKEKGVSYGRSICPWIGST